MLSNACFAVNSVSRSVSLVTSWLANIDVDGISQATPLTKVFDGSASQDARTLASHLGRIRFRGWRMPHEPDVDLYLRRS